MTNKAGRVKAREAGVGMAGIDDVEKAISLIDAIGPTSSSGIAGWHKVEDVKCSSGKFCFFELEWRLIDKVGPLSLLSANAGEKKKLAAAYSNCSIQYEHPFSASMTRSK